MNYFLSTLTLILFSINATGQAPFEKVYLNGPYDQEGTDVVPTSDGGYLISGYTTNSILYDTDALITRVDASGNKVSEYPIGGNKPDFVNRILPLSDGSFFTVGYTQSYGGGDLDVFLVKLKSDFSLDWSKDIGDFGNQIGMDIIASNDGNYIIVGSEKAPGKDYNMVLWKVDPNGTELAKKTYGGSSNEYGNSVKMCSDGGFIILGQTYSYGTNGDAYMVRTKPDLEMDWYRTFGGAQRDEGIYIHANPDDTFTFLVRDSSNAGADIDVMVYKTNSTGENVIWSRAFGGTDKDTPKMIQPTSDGGYIIAAISRSFGWQNPDMWIIKIQGDGTLQWSSHFGGPINEHCYTVRELSDGSYIAVGKNHSAAPDMNIMLVKMNSWGTLDVGLNESSLNSDFSVYPNPSTGAFQVKSATPIKNIQIFSSTGQLILTQKVSEDSQFQYSEKLKQGIYFLVVETENKSVTQKLVID